MTHNHQPDALDAALKRATQPRAVDDVAVSRVLEGLRPPLPRQKVSWWRLPPVLLDWQFAPAWPRVAALACFGALGFYVGIAGLDRSFDNLDAPYAVASRADIGSVVFEPEPFSGARP